MQIKKCKSCVQWEKDYGWDVHCRSCDGFEQAQALNFATIDKVYLRDYGNESVNRIKEMERRVILPYEKPGGGYYVGRRGENGKVQERHPDY